MSKHSFDYLNENVAVGFTSYLGDAWWSANGDASKSQFEGPVPMERARELFGWEPVKVAIMREGDDGRAVPLKDWRGDAPVVVTRSDKPNQMLGIFSEKYPDTGYTERLLDGLSAILDDSLGTRIGSIGLLDGGQKGWVQVTTGEIQEHAPTGEQFQTWLCAYTSLDGTLATTFKKGATRVVCDNTFDMFRTEKGSKYRYKNTANSGLKVATARDVLDILAGVETDLWADLDRYVSQKVTDDQWVSILDEIVPVPVEEGRGQTVAENKRLEIEKLYHDDYRVSAFQGTQWGAFQAFSTHNQHATTVRKNDNEYQRNMRKLLSGKTFDFDVATMDSIEKVLVPA